MRVEWPRSQLRNARQRSASLVRHRGQVHKGHLLQRVPGVVAVLAGDAALAMRSSLPRLGAEGMARRMEVLMQEGLVK